MMSLLLGKIVSVCGFILSARAASPAARDMSKRKADADLGARDDRKGYVLDRPLLSERKTSPRPALTRARLAPTATTSWH